MAAHLPENSASCTDIDALRLGCIGRAVEVLNFGTRSKGHEKEDENDAIERPEVTEGRQGGGRLRRQLI